jgi:hypothetical protein
MSNLASEGVRRGQREGLMRRKKGDADGGREEQQEGGLERGEGVNGMRSLPPFVRPYHSSPPVRCVGCDINLLLCLVSEDWEYLWALWMAEKPANIGGRDEFALVPNVGAARGRFIFYFSDRCATE